MSRTETGKQKAVVGIYAFEIIGVMNKLARLCSSLSDEQALSLSKYISDSVGFKKLLSHDANFIKGLIQGDWFENMIPITNFVARLGKCYCSDPRLKDFEHVVCDWINKGVDPLKWIFPWHLMEEEFAKNMEQEVDATKEIVKNMEKLAELETTLKDVTATLDKAKLLAFQNKVERQRLRVEKYLELWDLWNMNFNDIVRLLARFVLTILSRIKTLFGVPQLMADAYSKDGHHVNHNPSILMINHKLLDFPPDTLGVAALHYANIVIRIQNLAEYPSDIYDYRAEVYNMLPRKLRVELSERLPSIYSSTESVRDLAAQKNAAMAEILEWLAPLAHNTKKWLSNRNIEQNCCVSSSHVLLVETLYFANQQKTEEIIVELIVGLQYSWQAFVEEELALHSSPEEHNKLDLGYWLIRRIPNSQCNKNIEQARIGAENMQGFWSSYQQEIIYNQDSRVSRVRIQLSGEIMVLFILLTIVYTYVYASPSFNNWTVDT